MQSKKMEEDINSPINESEFFEKNVQPENLKFDKNKFIDEFVNELKEVESGLQKDESDKILENEAESQKIILEEAKELGKELFEEKNPKKEIEGIDVKIPGEFDFNHFLKENKIEDENLIALLKWYNDNYSKLSKIKFRNQIVKIPEGDIRLLILAKIIVESNKTPDISSALLKLARHYYRDQTYLKIDFLSEEVIDTLNVHFGIN